MNFLVEFKRFCVFIVVVVVVGLSETKFPVEKTCCLSSKTREKNVCRGRMIGLTTEMARVAEVDRGNFVCVFHWHQLRTRNNICSCPLPTHSATLSNTPIPDRVFDEEGRKKCHPIVQVQNGVPVADEMRITFSPLRTNIKDQRRGKG